jgi:hypothetical protein
MDKDTIKKISDDAAGDAEVRAFDAMLKGALLQNPSARFTDRVMARIKPGVAGAGQMSQYWFVLAGIVLAGSLWLFGGLGNEAPSTDINLPQIVLPQVDYAIVGKGFGFVAVLLLLLVIDKVVNRRKMVG